MGGLDGERLRARLGAGWARVEVVAETDSTNADLVADAEAPDHSVRAAEVQRAGRGRLDRTWVAAPGTGLTFSMLVRPSAPIATWGWLPLLTGVALQAAVREVAGVAAALKWPNDLLLGRLGDAHPDAPQWKAAGILAQSSGAAVVIGIGLNVSQTADQLPVERATSLALAGAPDLDHTDLLAAILTRFDERYLPWLTAGGDAEASGLAADYRKVCATIGAEVSVSTTAGGVLRGPARGVDAHGRLEVDTPDGPQVIGAGDVEHLRPA